MHVGVLCSRFPPAFTLPSALLRRQLCDQRSVHEGEMEGSGWMSDVLVMFCMLIYPPLHPIISACIPLCLTNSICNDREVLESTGAFVWALSVCIWVCVGGGGWHQFWSNAAAAVATLEQKRSNAILGP